MTLKTRKKFTDVSSGLTAFTLLILTVLMLTGLAFSVPAEAPNQQSESRYEVSDMDDRGKDKSKNKASGRGTSFGVMTTQSSSVSQQGKTPPGLMDTLKGKNNGGDVKESVYSGNSVLSSYGTEFQMVGQGSTKSMQEATYRFRDRNSKSLVAIDDNIDSVRFYTYENRSLKDVNVSGPRSTVKDREFLNYSEKTQLKGSLIGDDGRVSPLLESYLQTVSGKNKKKVGNFLNLNGLVIPSDGVNLYQIKHHPKDWVYAEIRSKNNFSFIAMDPAGAQATYDSSFSAPYCSNGGSPCVANSSLLLSRGDMGPGEPNSPNTIDAATDGGQVTNGYEQEESVENITVESLDHDVIGAGDQVEVTTWYYCYGTSDVINFAYTSSTSSINWNVQNSGACDGSPGPFSRTTTFTLADNGNNQAVRVINEYNGDGGTIETTSGYGDQDDLVFNVDGQAPSITLESPSDGSVFQSGEIIDFSFSDPENHFNSASYTLDGGTTQSLTAPYEIDTSSWSEGTHTLDVTASDSAGNQRTQSFQFTVDDTEPYVEILSPENQLYATDSLTLDYTASDPNFGQAFYSLNGESNQSLSGSTGFVADERQNNLILYAEDSAGNLNSTSVSFEVDTLEPEIVLDSPPNNSEVEQGLYINLSLNEPNLESVKFSHNGGPNSTDFTGSFDIPTNKWPEKRFAGDRMIYVDKGTGQPVIQYPDGTEKTLTVSPSITGEMADLDSDSDPELPFIDSSGNLKIVDTLGETQTLASGLSTSSEVIGVGDWKGTFEYVFYADPTDNNYIKKVRAGTNPQTVLSGISANSVLGPANFTADGDQELVFLGTSNTLQYIDDSTVKTTGFSSFGSNNQLGIGSPSDLDNDGKARVPFVDGSNNLGLVNSDGVTEILDTNYGKAVKTVPAAVDWAGDSRDEIIHISSNSQRIYYSFINGTSKMVEDSSGNPVTGLPKLGVQKGPDQRVNNLRIYANDSNSRSSKKYFEFNITKNNPPVVLLDDPDNGSAIKGDSIINLTVSDSNLLSTSYSLDGGSNQSDFIGSNDIQLSLSSEGFFTLDVYAEDTEGAITSKSYEFEVDNTKPELTVYSPEEKIYGSSDVDLNYTASDKNLDSVYYSLNGASNTTLSDNTTLTVPEGENTLKVYAEDTAGNIRTVEKIFTSDITAPSITIENPKDTTYFQKDIPAEVRLDEEGASCTYAVDSSSNQSMTKDDPENFSSTMTGLSYGSHNVEFWCEDLAGNLANSPEITFSNSKPKALYDPGLGAPYCAGGESPCEVLEELIVSKNDIATNEPNSPNTIDGATDGTSGTYQNDESVDQVNVTDNDASTFSSGHSVTVSTRVYCYGTSDVVNILSTDSISSPSWTVESSQACGGAGFEKKTATFALTGTGNVSIRVLNEYNGDGTTTATSSGYGDQDDVVIPLDNFAPNIGLNSPENNSIIKPGDELDFRINDTKYDNLGTVTVVNDSNQNYTVESPHIIDTSGWSAGTQQVTVWANDTAGNYASKDFQFRVDQGPPTASNLVEKQDGSEVSRVYVGETYDFSGLWNDDLQLDYSNISSNLTGSFQNNSLTNGVNLNGGQDYANFSFTLPSTDQNVLGWKLWAKDQAGYFGESNVASIEIWERISLFWEQPSGGNVVRGFKQTFSCSLEESIGGDRISGYPVNFYLNNSTTTQRLGETNTNINGLASYTWDSTGYVLDDYTASCNITEDTAQQYSLEKGEANTTFTLERDNKPQWRNQVQRYDEISARRSNELSAQGFDEEGLREGILATNESGVWDNKSNYGSPVSLSSSGTYEWTNFTWINQSAANKKVGWKIWYRDSGQQYTSTPVKTFNVSPSDVRPPEIDILNPANGSFRRTDFTFTGFANEIIKSWTYNLDGGTNETVPPTKDYGLAYVDSSTSRLNILYRNGTLIDTSVIPSIISGTGNVDNDKRNEIVFIDGTGNLKALDRSGEVVTLASGLSTSKTPVAVSNWNSEESYVFYPDPGDSNRIKKVREGESPQLVQGGISSEGVMGAGDLNADGDKDLVFLGSSSTVKFIEGGSVKSTGFSSFGENNALGLGEPVDADRDGISRIPFVDSSNNLGLLSRNGETEILNPNYGASGKAKVTGLDVKEDSAAEIVHIDSSNRVSLQYLDGSTETLTYGGGTYQAERSKGVTSWRPYNPGREQNFSRTGLSEGYHQVNFWANDTEDNTGYENLGFRVDLTEPGYRAYEDNVTDYVFQTRDAGISLQPRDNNSGIHKVLLSTNETGSFDNRTDYTITENNVSDAWLLEEFKWKNTSFSGTLGYKVWIGDAAGNYRELPEKSFKVRKVERNFSTGEIRFNETNLTEGQPVSVKTNISSDIYTPEETLGVNFTVETFNGTDWEYTEHNIETVTLGPNTSTETGFTWEAGTGPFRFNATADPEDQINEVNETDNFRSTINDVSSYNIFYGGNDVTVKLDSDKGYRMLSWGTEKNDGNIYFADADAYYSFGDLKPVNQSGDFQEVDEAINLKGHNDSIQKSYSLTQTRCFNITGSNVCDVPTVNSTVTESFKTGILYDSSDGEGFDGGQDIVFIANTNSSKTGKYGEYDYEARIPSSLGEQKAGTDNIDVFTEIN